MSKYFMPYTGSFQKGIPTHSENPVEEVWDRIALLGTEEYLKEAARFNSPNPKADELRSYATVRFRQAVEFRAVGAQGSVLTAPLSLYYSFLNLTRAFLAIGPEVDPAKGHGLQFKHDDSDLLSNGAKVISGTFKDYLAAMGATEPGGKITLLEALSYIPELAVPFNSGARGKSKAVLVWVHGTRGEASLEFDKRWIDVDDFRRNWEQVFPQLVDCCELEPDGANLKITDDEAVKDYTTIADFCEKHLETDLVPHSRAPWYALRHDTGDVLPRPAYYLVAMFILGNIVRYQPEVMLVASHADSEVGWFLKKFLRTAERFYPQQMLSWFWQETVFF